MSAIKNTMTAVAVATCVIHSLAGEWNGQSQNFGDSASWNGAAPSQAEPAIFNAPGIGAAQTVLLNDEQTTQGVIVNGNAADGVTIRGGATPSSLNIDSQGIKILEGAGSLVIDNDVWLTHYQTWTNGSANPVALRGKINGVNRVEAVYGQPLLALRGAGGFVFNGEVSVTNTTRISGAEPLTVYSTGVEITDKTVFAPAAPVAFSGGTRLLNNDFPVRSAARIQTGDGLTVSGDGPLFLDGAGVMPALTTRQYSNQNTHFRKSAPVTVRRWSMVNNDNATGANNNNTGPNFMSSANLAIEEITEANFGSSARDDNCALAVSFQGAGANLTLANNGFYGQGDTMPVNSLLAVTAANSGYNSISIGGEGGEGAVITPLGLGRLSTNSGSGFYLIALDHGQVLTNDFDMGGSTNNDGGMPIGFDGDNSLVYGGSWNVDNSIIFPVLGEGKWTFTNRLYFKRPAGSGFTTYGRGTVEFAASSVITGVVTTAEYNGNIGKQGSGTLILSGTNTLAGKNQFRAGKVILNYSELEGNKLAWSTNTTATVNDALALGGADLQLKGGATAQTLGASGVPRHTTIEAGHSKIRRDGGASTIALGKIAARNNNGTIDFQSGVAKTTQANYGELLGYGATARAFATVDGQDWAVNDGAGNIVPFSGYSTFTAPGSVANILLTETDTRAGTYLKTLKIAPDAPGRSFTISSGTLNIENSGLLFVGEHDFSINGPGTIYGSGGNELLLHHYGTGDLIINAPISGSGGMQLVKTGPGKLILPANGVSNNNNLQIFDGIVEVAADNKLGGGGGRVRLNGGTLRTTGDLHHNRIFEIGWNGGTLDVADDTTHTISNNVIMSGGAAYGSITKTGGGTLVLGGQNTWLGPVEILGGTVIFASDCALGNASTNTRVKIAPVAVRNGAAIDLNGRDSWIGNFELENGALLDTKGGGKIGAYRFVLKNGEVSANLSDLKIANASNFSDVVNVWKRGAGTVTLSSHSVYGGGTFVEDGTLVVNGSISNSAPIVYDPGTLAGNGYVGRTINVEKGGTLAPSGQMTLGRSVRFADGAKFKVEISANAFGALKLENPDARVKIEENAEFEISFVGYGIKFPDEGLKLIDNQGSNPIEGEFAGVPQDGIMINSGRRARIDYRGGDGNDIVMTVLNDGTMLIVR